MLMTGDYADDSGLSQSGDGLGHSSIHLFFSKTSFPVAEGWRATFSTASLKIFQKLQSVMSIVRCIKQRRRSSPSIVCRRVGESMKKRHKNASAPNSEATCTFPVFVEAAGVSPVFGETFINPLQYSFVLSMDKEPQFRRLSTYRMIHEKKVKLSNLRFGENSVTVAWDFPNAHELSRDDGMFRDIVKSIKWKFPWNGENFSVNGKNPSQ